VFFSGVDLLLRAAHGAEKGRSRAVSSDTIAALGFERRESVVRRLDPRTASPRFPRHPIFGAQNIPKRLVRAARRHLPSGTRRTRGQTTLCERADRKFHPRNASKETGFFIGNSSPDYPEYPPQTSVMASATLPALRPTHKGGRPETDSAIHAFSAFNPDRRTSISSERGCGWVMSRFVPGPSCPFQQTHRKDRAVSGRANGSRFHGGCVEGGKGLMDDAGIRFRAFASKSLITRLCGAAHRRGGAGPINIHAQPVRRADARRSATGSPSLSGEGFRGSAIAGPPR